jgi:methyl-accepting chemotaxis protein
VAGPLSQADYFEPSWMSSTFALRQIDGYFHSANYAGYYVKDAAINARSTSNEVEFHSTVWLCHGDPADAPGGLVQSYGRQRGFHRRVGEVASVISLRVSLSETCAAADRLAWRLIGMLVALLGALSAAQLWMIRRYLLSPLAAIRARAIEVTGDETHLGEAIPEPFSRELGELVSAFNSMSTGLRTERDHLEARIAERTATIASANESLTREIAA